MKRFIVYNYNKDFTQRKFDVLFDEGALEKDAHVMLILPGTTYRVQLLFGRNDVGVALTKFRKPRVVSYQDVPYDMVKDIVWEYINMADVAKHAWHEARTNKCSREYRDLLKEVLSEIKKGE